MEKASPLKVLFLEENQSEIKLFESILLDSHVEFESKSAKTENDFTKFVNRFKPDVILAGTNLTKYSVHEALDFLKEQSLMIPFILVTSSISEELAKEYMKNGVDEYLTKYNLLSMPAVITKAIGIKTTLRQKIETDVLNKTNESKLQAFFENNPESIFEVGFNCEIINLNKSAKQLLGLSETKFAAGKTKFSDYIEPSQLKEFKQVHSEVCRGQKRNILIQIENSKSHSIWLDCKLLPHFDIEQNVSSVLLIGINVTEKEKVKTELSIAKTNYEKLVSSIDEAIWSVDKDFNIVDFNEVASKMIYKIRGIKIKSGTTLKDFAINNERVIVWTDRFNRALSGEKFHVEDLYDLNGGKIYTQTTLYPIYENKEIVGVSILARDNSQFKKAEVELLKSEQTFRTLSENAPVGIIKLDDKGNCNYANGYLTKMLNTTIEKMIGIGWLDFIYKDDQKEFRTKLTNFLKSKNNMEAKIRLSGSDKNLIWAKIGVTVIHDIEETSAIGTVTDITNLKRAHDELTEKQIIIDAVEQNSKVGFWVRNFHEDDNAQWSDAIYSIFEQEKSKGPIDYSKIVNLIHPDDRENYIKAINSVRNGSFMNIEYRLMVESGIVKYVLVSAYPIFDKSNRVVKMSGTILDLTDIYTKDIELSNQKKLMNSAFEVANIGLWEYNINERTSVWSKETKKMFGLKENQAPLSLEIISAMIHPDDRSGFLDFYNAQVITGKARSFEYRIFVHGEIRTHLSYSSPFMNTVNQVNRLTGIVMDKTISKKTEQKLIASETLFNSFFENAPDAIFIEDAEGNILNVNNKACELQGLERSSLIGKNFSDLIPENSRMKVMTNFKRLFNGEISEHIGQAFTLSGNPFNIEIKATKISYKDIPAILLNVREV